jgi:hypothetical protein
MLGNEYWVPSHRSLLLIIFGNAVAGPNLIVMKSMAWDRPVVDTLGLDVLTVLICQFETPGSEFGFFQGGEGGDINICKFY